MLIILLSYSHCDHVVVTMCTSGGLYIESVRAILFTKIVDSKSDQGVLSEIVITVNIKVIEI